MDDQIHYCEAPGCLCWEGFSPDVAVTATAPWLCRGHVLLARGNEEEFNEMMGQPVDGVDSRLPGGNRGRA